MSRNFKRLFTLAMAGVLCATSFVGCGGKTQPIDDKTTKQEQTKLEAEKTTAEPVTLKIMHWRVEDADIFAKLNEQFENENAGIKIEMDMVPTKDYYNVLNVRLGNSEVDIVGVPPIGQAINVIPGIISSGALMDLTGQKFLENYNPSTIGNNAKYDGKVITVPTSLNTAVVFYNKDVFKKLGIEVPNNYAQFIDACKKIKESGIAPIAFGGKDGWPINVSMLAVEASIVRSQKPDFYKQLATGETKFTDPEFLEVIKKTQEISSYFEEKSMGVAYADTYPLFAQQKAAMIIDGSWAAGDIQKSNPEFEVGTFLFPGSDKADPAQFVPVKYGLNWSVSNGTKVKDAALKYLTWFSQKDVYTQYITAIKQLPTQDGISFEDPLVTSISSLLGSNVEFADQLYPAGSNLDPYMLLQEMVIGVKTPEDVAKEMQATVDNIK